MNRSSLAILLLCLSVILSSSKPFKVACIGDSITYGAFLEDRENESYPTVLQNILGPGYEVRNFGLNGRVLLRSGDYPYIQEPMYLEMKAFLPDVVTIMLGTNDSKPHNWTSAENFREDYKTMIREIKALPSHPRIYLCLPLWTDLKKEEGIDGELIASEIIPVVKEVASWAWADVIDTYSPFYGKPELFIDRLHPSREGDVILAETIHSALSANGDAGKPGKRILFIGDSITDGGWGAANAKPSSERNHYDGNHIFGHSYAADCASFYLAEYPERGYRFFNRGISGNRLRDLVGRWDDDVLAVHPDIVSIYIGVNGSGSGSRDYDIAEWEAQYRALLDRTLAFDSEIKFVLCTPFLAEVGGIVRKEDFRLMRETVRQRAEAVRRIASDYGAVLVPFDEEMERLISTDRSSDAHHWSWDGVHPTYAAHLKFAQLWEKKVGKL